MYNSGDAAEQVVRMSLEGAEFALKITGSAAKNLAAALYTVLKDQKKTKGKARIEAMLREKRPLKVYRNLIADCALSLTATLWIRNTDGLFMSVMLMIS